MPTLWVFHSKVAWESGRNTPPVLQQCKYFLQTLPGFKVYVRMNLLSHIAGVVHEIINSWIFTYLSSEGPLILPSMTSDPHNLEHRSVTSLIQYGSQTFWNIQIANSNEIKNISFQQTFNQKLKTFFQICKLTVWTYYWHDNIYAYVFPSIIFVTKVEGYLLHITI